MTFGAKTTSGQSAEEFARTVVAVYCALAQNDAPCLDNITALVEMIRARDLHIGKEVVAETRYCDAEAEAQLMTRAEIALRVLGRMKP